MGRCTGPSKEKEHKLLEKMKTQIAFLLFALLVGVSGEALQNVKAQDNADIQDAKVSDALAALDALDSGNESGEDALESAADEDDEDAMMAADPEPVPRYRGRRRGRRCRRFRGRLICSGRVRNDLKCRRRRGQLICCRCMYGRIRYSPRREKVCKRGRNGRRSCRYLRKRG